MREFEVNQPIWARTYRGEAPWCQGHITERLSPVSEKVQVDGMTWKRHVDQLKERQESEVHREADRGLYSFHKLLKFKDIS